MIQLDPVSLQNYAIAGVALIGAFLAALWAALVVWTFRDMRARSRDFFAQLLAAIVVLVLNIPGFIVYLILRPRETVAEGYARSLEEEALLQSIEERPFCPGCNRLTRPAWLVCPHCQILLRKTCSQCKQPLELTWNICPLCSAPAPGREARAAIDGG